MNVQILSHANAFNPGSEVWFMPDLEDSNWTKKINWYLNFQISNTRHINKQSLPTSLVNILAQTEVSLTKQLTSEDQIIIPSNHLLPNKYCIIKKWTHPQSWFEHVYNQYNKLNKPSIRIFLTKETTAQQASQIMSKLFKEADVSIVAELADE